VIPFPNDEDEVFALCHTTRNLGSSPFQFLCVFFDLQRQKLLGVLGKEGEISTQTLVAKAHSYKKEKTKEERKNLTWFGTSCLHPWNISTKYFIITCNFYKKKITKSLIQFLHGKNCKPSQLQFLHERNYKLLNYNFCTVESINSLMTYNYPKGGLHCSGEDKSY